MTDPSIPPAVIVPDPPIVTTGDVLAQLDAAKTAAADTFQLLENQRALTVVAEGHLHDAEVKLTERDAEIVVLRAQLEAKVAAVEVTCPTCGTRTTVG